MRAQSRNTGRKADKAKALREEGTDVIYDIGTNLSSFICEQSVQASFFLIQLIPFIYNHNKDIIWIIFAVTFYNKVWKHNKDIIFIIFAMTFLFQNLQK